MTQMIELPIQKKTIQPDEIHIFGCLASLNLIEVLEVDVEVY